MNNKISIIVPVYKAEKVIDRCVGSLVSQTLKEIEIILVNDGSTDASGAICDAYADKDDRVTVIHQQNCGPSAARNTGLRNASGEYIAFVDCDDYLENNFCELMYHTAILNKVDIVNCDYYREDERVESIASQFPKDVVVEHGEILLALKRAHETRIIWFACRNLYRKALLIRHQICFNEELHLGEDPVFNLYAFYYAQSMYSLSRCLYHYVATPDSLTQIRYDEQLLDKLALQYQAKLAFYEAVNLLQGDYQRDFYTNTIEHTLVLLLLNVYQRPGSATFKQLKKVRESAFIEQSFTFYRPSGKLSVQFQAIIFLLKYNRLRLVDILFRFKLRDRHEL